MPLWWPLLLASVLFGIGVYGVLARRNAILVLMGVELMLNAVNLTLVAFDAQLRDVLHSGQTLALFVVVVAAAEIGLALAIVLLVFRTHGHIDVPDLTALADRDPASDPASDTGSDTGSDTVSDPASDTGSDTGWAEPAGPGTRR